MPLGVVNDSDFDDELENSTPPVKKIPPPEPVMEPEIVDDTHRGRKEGDVNVPMGLRSLIAGIHNTEGREAALELAGEFGISSSSVSAYAKGATSTTTYDQPKKEILDFVKRRKKRITKKALHMIVRSLDNITEDKLRLEDAKSLASIAKDMSHVVNHMSPETVPGSLNNNGVNFILYSPQVREENEYGAIRSIE